MLSFKMLKYSLRLILRKRRNGKKGNKERKASLT
jgi:hypothetical protein